MATRIDGDNVTVPGQVAVSGPATIITHVVTRGLCGVIRAYVKGLNLNAAAPVDLTPISVPSTQYIPVRCFVYNPTANLAAATLGLYTAAGAGGVAIVSPVLLASVTAVGKFQALTIAALTDVITATTIYPRLTVAAGVAGTVALVLEFQDLSLI